MHALYNLAAWMAQPLLRRKLAARARAEPLYGQWVAERFGRAYAAPAVSREDERPLWIHAVSLGETRAAAILAQALRARRPGLRLLLTHGTATGRAEGAKLLQAGDAQAWQPWDTPAAVARFLAHFRPCAGVLMETEIWPNLIAQSAAQGVPLALANARLSEKSLRAARRAAWLMRPAYTRLAAAWAQTDADAARLRQMGAPVAGVFGNLKFDARPDPALLALGQRWREQARQAGRAIVMLASSRDGEEAAFMQAIVQARAADAAGLAGIQWLIVPRHPQRFDEVARLAQSHGLRVSRRSAWSQDANAENANEGANESTNAAPPAADLWLGDSLGEMPAYYAAARVALLGASFAPLGGQNLIEAAACACPVVMGPHTFNFAQAAESAQAAGAALRAPDMPAALAAALTLARDEAAHERAAQAALALIAAHRGAADRTADAVLTLMDEGLRQTPP